MTTTLAATQHRMIGGVDCHKYVHHAVALDQRGARLADPAFPASRAGYQQLETWLLGFGVIDKIGIESTGTYGAGLARCLTGVGGAGGGG